MSEYVSERLPSVTLADPRLAILSMELEGGKNLQKFLLVKGQRKKFHSETVMEDEEKVENTWANLAWNTCMSKPGLGKLLVPVPNLSLTDWLSWAAFCPVSE